MLSHEQISLSNVLFDATNFFTFIDSTNEHCELPQRGKNKQGRNNLRQVGVLLLVSRQEVFPLFHATYAGNKPDSTVFADNSNRLVQRLKSLVSDIEKVTFVFDRGNNSQKNLSEETLPLHYVGALVPSQHGDLLQEAIVSYSRHSRRARRSAIESSESCGTENGRSWCIDPTNCMKANSVACRTMSRSAWSS